jgi:hypothetical protein
MKSRIATVPLLAALGLIAVLLGAPAAAGFDVSFGAGVRLDDDTELYLAINSRYFDRDTHEVRMVAERYRNPDDLAVALFLCHRSGRSADQVYRLRREGLSWWEISVRLGVPAEVWYVEAPRAAGPPYGKAHGYWKKHERHHRQARLTDADLRNLVAVRMIHEYYDVPVEVAIDWRSSGESLQALMSGEYHRRHGRHDDDDDRGGNRHGGRGNSKKHRK